MCVFITGLFKLCCRHNGTKWHNSLRLHILSEEPVLSLFLCLSEYLSWEKNILLPRNKILNYSQCFGFDFSAEHIFRKNAVKELFWKQNYSLTFESLVM